IFIRDRGRFDLEKIEQAGLHQCPKPFVERFRTVGLASQAAEALLNEARMQSREAIDKNFAAKMIKLTRRNRDIDWDYSVDSGSWVGRCRFNFHFVVTPRAIERLETPRNVRDARVGKRLF